MPEVALTLVETFPSTSKGCVTNISGTLFVRQPTEESKQLWKTLNWVCKCCVCFDMLRAEDALLFRQKISYRCPSLRKRSEVLGKITRTSRYNEFDK